MSAKDSVRRNSWFEQEDEDHYRNNDYGGRRGYRRQPEADRSRSRSGDSHRRCSDSHRRSSRQPCVSPYGNPDLTNERDAYDPAAPPVPSSAFSFHGPTAAAVTSSADQSHINPTAFGGTFTRADVNSLRPTDSTTAPPALTALPTAPPPPTDPAAVAEYLATYQQNIFQAALLAQSTAAGAVPYHQLDPATKHARKVYVGNLPQGATEMSIQSFMNEALNSRLPNKPPGDAAVGVYLNEARRFAFVEHRSIEEANYLLTLDGIVWMGNSLKLRRPQDYSPSLAEMQFKVEMHAKNGVSSLVGAVGLTTPEAPIMSGAPPVVPIHVVSTSVEDGPNKVFIGGLPHMMTEEDCKELLQSFGPLKSFHLVKDRDRGNECKGYAFCEFLDDKSTDMACQGLNGMAIADRTLNVRRATPGPGGKYASTFAVPATPPPPTQPVPQSSQLSGQPEALRDAANGADNTAAAPSGWSDGREGVDSTKASPGKKPESFMMGNYEAATTSLGRVRRVVAIKNMATLDQLTNPGSRQRWISDASKQCSCVAHVHAVEIQGSDVLVECDTTQEAVQTMKMLQGKMYDGRLLQVAFAEATPAMKKDSVFRLLKEVADDAAATDVSAK